MSFALNEDQNMLAQTARDFINEHSPISRVRKLRDDGVERAYSRELFKQMAELGWTAIPFSEADGGMDMGLASMVLVTEAMGRGLAPEPLLTSVMMGGRAIALAGSDAQKAGWLEAIMLGTKVVALAHYERGARYAVTRVTTKAERRSGGYILTGEKTQVLDGVGADAFVVPARTSGGDSDRDGITLFLVPRDAAGLSIAAQSRVDSRNAAHLTLAGVSLDDGSTLGGVDGAGQVLEQVIDAATVALCGEMLGGMSQAFEVTLDYLKERKQFDAVIGTFQALKHRAARMFIEIELARSAVMAAARALDEHAQEGAMLVSLAKARCSDAYVLVANEAVQLHGGIGMTDEHDIGFFMKRSRATEMTFGDAAHHRNRYATLNGY